MKRLIAVDRAALQHTSPLAQQCNHEMRFAGAAAAGGLPKPDQFYFDAGGSVLLWRYAICAAKLFANIASAFEACVAAPSVGL
jgi:hypothetical protein